MSNYEHSRVLEGTYHEHRSVTDGIKPLNQVLCKKRGCDRSVYSNEVCKMHADIEFYKQLTKAR